MSEHVVLVGLMGSGKSTVGRQLAVLLNRPLIDNDEQVRALAGASVAEISLREGVPEMRRLESQALTEALASPVPAVITAAAGTILDEEARRKLREPYVVWLRAESATLARRVVADPLRPLLGDQPEAVLRTLDEQRSALYAEVADVALQVDQLDPADVAARIAAQLPPATGGGGRE
jgi:shikimate kinase